MDDVSVCVDVRTSDVVELVAVLPVSSGVAERRVFGSDDVAGAIARLALVLGSVCDVIFAVCFVVKLGHKIHKMLQLSCYFYAWALETRIIHVHVNSFFTS